MEKSSARIFLADQRHEEKSVSWMSLCSELEGQHSAVRIREVGLMADQSFAWSASTKKPRLILPLSGNLKLITTGKIELLEIGSAVILTESFIIKNPYSENSIHWIELEWNGPGEYCRIDLSSLSKRNHLHPLLTAGNSLQVSIGKFDGRIDATEEVSTSSEVFVYIIGGVFEVQNRLLNERDGLWVTGISELAFEGLGTEGIILVLKSN